MEEGSGITIYGLIVPNAITNFTVTINGTARTPPQATNLLANTSAPLYNQTLYNISSLPWAQHNLVLTAAPVNIEGSEGGSNIMFDYALVNNSTNPARTEPTTNQ